MKYYGTFKNVKDEQYTVNIITENNPSATKEITLGKTPFILKGKSDGLYSTLKLREAMITIVNDSYLFDLYSSTAHGTKIEVYDKAKTPVFIGYVTPNAYNQGYSELYEEIEIQAVDGVSTLEYFNYETNNKTIVSFLSIIDKCLSKCNCYTTLIYPKSIKLSSTDTSDFLSKLHISEYNFFDDDEEVTPHKMKDVLDEMLKYLGLTLTVYNNEVFILDYDYIKTGGTVYWKHTINGSTATVSLSDNYVISSASHEGSDTTLSLSDTYNQVSININLYEIKDLIPDLFENKFLKNVTSKDNGFFNHYVERDPSNCDGKWHYLCKFYKNTRYKQRWFTPVSHIEKVSLPYTENDIAINDNIGCALARVACYDKTTDKPSSLSWEDWIQCGLGLFGHEDSFNTMDKIATEIKLDFPILEIIPDFQIEAAFNSIDNTTRYIVIGGDYYQNDETAYVNRDKSQSGEYHSEGGYKVMKAKLQIGNKYWNGDSWTTTESTFIVSFGNDNDKYYYTWLACRNTVTFDMGIDSEGYAIPLKPSDKICGKVNFTLYRPKPKAPISIGEVAFGKIPKFCIFKNLTLELCTPTEDWTEQVDNDIKYTNVINDNFVNEFSDIELKVNSQTEKGYSFSSVLEKSGSDFIYNTSLYYTPLGKSQLQEYNLIEKMYNHFKDTKKILTATIVNAIKPYSTVRENNLSTTFVVDTQEIDYAADSGTVTLNEV